MNIGFWGALTLILVTIKLTGAAQFSWLWCVAAPFGPLIIAGAIMATSVILIGIITAFSAISATFFAMLAHLTNRQNLKK